ncbi:phage tail protein [Halomonas sp. OfavH-34-E]|uniref:phage tail-collar fiber domain-containing protein n=1 Tax=Halomonas sp. OfavH-34-E TaxID=2954491 RepID=UPI0020977DC7|nr:phage tail protein [Halomonas sp. OfavH-34-E]MCO7218008.1 phage tail protein [Halomonas sp. OfavH-34-E]
MPQFYTLLTDTGQAKLANAVALGQSIEITELAVGDGGGSLPTPDSSATALVNEVRRAPINASQTDPDNPSWIVVEQVLPPDVGGWTIREIGVYDVDGDLIGIGNYPETYKPVLAEGSSRTQTVRFVLEVSDTSAVTLKVDPSVVLATREYSDAGDEALMAAIEQAIADAGYQFANYDGDRIYTTGEVVRGSDGAFYEFYDRDQAGTTQGTNPTNAANRPHIWMEWDGVTPGATIEWRSETLPEGYIENDGAEISRADYRRIFDVYGITHGDGDGSTTFHLPDDRGEFKRGWDNGKGVDAGRSLASWQKPTLVGGYDDNNSGSHSVLFDKSDVDYGSDPFSSSDYPGYRLRYAGTGSEVSTSFGRHWLSATRPRNNAVIYLTKI